VQRYPQGYPCTISQKNMTTIKKELEEAALLIRTIIKKKHLHIEYTLSERGRALIPIFTGIEDLS